MSESDVNQSTSVGVGRQRGVFLVDVNDWDSASRDSVLALGSNGTDVTCTSSEERSCRMFRDRPKSRLAPGGGDNRQV